MGTKLIGNLRRSPDLWQKIDFEVSPLTTGEQLIQLKSQVNHFLKQNVTDYYSRCEVVPVETSDIDFLKFEIHFQQKHGDAVRRWSRFAKLLQIVREAVVDCQMEVKKMTHHQPKQQASFP